MVLGDAASGNDAVDVGMKLQALIPAIEHAEETNLGIEVPWIAFDFKQSLCTGVKEQVVDEPPVLQRERSQFPRQCEDGMYVASGQQLAFARLEPASTRVALAPRAVPVSVGVVGDPGRTSAAGAAVAMSALGGSATACNG